MKFYTKEDVQKITGLGNTASYDLIRNLNKQLKIEYPGTVTLLGRVPIWYFNKKILCEEGEENEKENK